MVGRRPYLEDVDRAMRLALTVSLAATAAALVVALVAGLDIALAGAIATLALLVGMVTGGFGLALLVPQPSRVAEEPGRRGRMRRAWPRRSPLPR